MADEDRHQPGRGAEGGSSLGEDSTRMEMISETEAKELLEGRDLIAIGMRADEVRRGLRGTKTTFVRVFEVHVDAATASLPPRTSAGEIRLVGSPRSLDAAVAAVRSARSLAAAIPLSGFSLADLVALDGASSLDATLRALRN